MAGEKVRNMDYFYLELEELATNIEKVLAADRYGLESYRAWSLSLSELRGLLLELIKTKNGKKLEPLLNRYLELEGKIKEMRNDLSLPNRMR